ncbi:four helix bundle protein [Candidatus Collierbacteria bacterium CG10_big_fil_rev_8_21_14_0_10_44_9]|uniref:Four helix bundle protein n=1 Tax=Candidatus Collierbacteria bacterium CG10_big_fil_rev_8_21_14_0_10_44_9 TaxID=1974535 RepID=A0A2H0VJ08_9BACT|nr:MAG: four helix bundle protein [Candidatus Collierbacteria bacterium CG10_big_fil_rev_8_21_14_0_10_44_9]
MIQDVTELEVYKISLALIVALNNLINLLPKTDFEMRSQLSRAGRSIPANIAEGFAKRKSAKEFKHFLTNALGSSDELVTHFRVIYLEYPNLRESVTTLAPQYKVLSKRINSLRSKWATNY